MLSVKCQREIRIEMKTEFIYTTIGSVEEETVEIVI